MTAVSGDVAGTRTTRSDEERRLPCADLRDNVGAGVRIMAEKFDPYHKWLAIPPEEQPADHYRLLGLKQFETDPDVISSAADRQMAHLRSFQAGQYAALSQNVLNEISAARGCLLNSAKKAAYDASLRTRIAEQQAAAPSMEESESADYAWIGIPDSAASSRSKVHPPRKKMPSWQLPAAIAAGVAIVIGIAALLLSGGGKKSTVAQPADGDKSEKTTKIAAGPPAKPPQAPGMETKLAWKPEAPPESSQPGRSPISELMTAPPQTEPPKIEPPKIESTTPEMNPEVKPEPTPPESTAVESPHEAVRRLRTALAEAKSPAQFRTIADDAIKLANSALDGGNEDLLKVGSSVLLIAARKADDNELVKAVTLGLVARRKVDTGKLAPAATVLPVARNPVPSDAAQSQALNLVRDVFQADCEKAKTPADKQALAKQMLTKARESTDSPAGQFALLKMARDIATEIGDGETTFQVIDEMAQVFEVDAVELKAGVLAKAPKIAKLPEHHKRIVEQALAIMDEALAKDKYDTAEQLGQMALASARKGNDKAEPKQVQGRIKEIRTAANEYEQMRTATGTLEEKPADPEANLAAGKYLCLTKGDWNKGLPMLALGSDAKLKEVALRELEGPTESAEQVKVGDTWWELAEKSEGLATGNLQRRAGYWYRSALPSLTGLAKDRAEKRLQEVESSAKSRSVASAKTLRPDIDIAFETGGVVDKTRNTRPIASGALQVVPGLSGKLAGRFAGGCITLGTYEVGDKPFSLEVLVRPLKGDGPQHFVGWHAGGSDGALWFGRGGESVSVGCRSASGRVGGNSPPILRAGLWYHIILVRDRRALTVYVNGGEAVSVDSPLFNLSTKDYPLMIGDEGHRRATFKGDIQFVRLYGDALSPQQMSALFRAIGTRR
jgi:hypothetical protein